MSVNGLSSTSSSYWEELFSSGSSKKSKKGDLGAELFSNLDTDGSGNISLKESGLDQDTYKKIDADNDGMVTQAELQVTLEMQRAAMQTRIKLEQQNQDFTTDANPDAVEKRGELLQGPAIPPIGNSATEGTEKTEAQEMLASILDGKDVHQAGGHNHNKRKAKGSDDDEESEDLLDQLFANLDKDDNGNINLEESGLGNSSSLFNAMDTNHDGSLSADEVSNAIENQNKITTTNQDASASGTNNLQDLFASLANGTSNTQKGQSILSSLANNAYLSFAQNTQSTEQGLNVMA